MLAERKFSNILIDEGKVVEFLMLPDVTCAGKVTITATLGRQTRSAMLALAGRDGEVARQLWTLTADALQRVQDHMLVLGCMNAKERVANFLLQLAKRVSGGDELELPMSRQDIADYLGLTIETVSRTMTQLENDATIGLPTSRHIVLRNRAALGRLNS